ncbi:16S rRNA (uracil(1498)-N(3))-methyltransferase [Pseudoroseicyclus aestuarii]|uniref:Ribosomal RNA small subunit methyltransferase E n=1 Tax=Pseudoroseicyclus aestuarii TaxID=1795041 RepID=A0A318SWI9_9RHOB|nr:16S rRNA (uracil(1498)-N(3))-methyltransferase [Pseudoroseicyclus aestuarii]PYE84746.1 16S rRNA (uracil1498-N3)-methyltransferase [Pseudoroseicyclus aestuarii]
MAVPRLYLDHPLAPGQTVPLERAQAHYLSSVMRLGAGAEVLVFNGRDGEVLARIEEAGKRGGSLRVEAATKPQMAPPDLWLLFAPIKKARTDFIVEKATEMGAARILPVLTDYTNAERVRTDRLQAHAVEAAEQCGGTYVPQVAEPVKLGALLDGWDPARRLMFCDEALVGAGSGLPARAAAPGPWAILIGPEGGFTEVERKRMAGLEASVAVSLGPRILRADTAAVAAMTLWQSALGDW